MKEQNKPIYIKPSEDGQKAGFIPQASAELESPQLAIEKPEVKAITFQPSPEVMTAAKEEAQAFAGAQSPTLPAASAQSEA